MLVPSLIRRARFVRAASPRPRFETMTSTLHLTIAGQDASQRLQKVLSEGESVRVGRTARDGWEIPWDQMISREHAVLNWAGGQLHAKCLEQARNPLVYRGHPTREVSIRQDEWFQIGHTTFHASYVVEDSAPKRLPKSQLVEFLDDDEGDGHERAFTVDELQRADFSDAASQMKV